MELGDLIFFILLVGFVVLILVGILRVLYSPIWKTRPSRAKEILQERYARGEISEQEYHTMLTDIEK